MIKAEIVGDSNNEFGNRITTMVVTMPRFILAEFNTHRMFSRNSASSRAIPFEKMIKSVEENPFIPIAWQKDHSGMQGNEYFTEQWEIDACIRDWEEAKDRAIGSAKALNRPNYYSSSIHREGKVTKQLANRLLEPFMWHTVIVTATEFENFFSLRCPQYRIQNCGGEVRHYRSRKDAIKADNGDIDLNTLTDLQWLECNKGQAEIHMMALAEAMWDAYNESIPKELKAGEWHIPYGDRITFDENNTPKYFDQFKDAEEKADHIDNCKVAISTTMAARTSYTVVGDDLKPMSYQKMIELHDKLVTADPLHASPMEHCAQAMNESQYYSSINGNLPIGKEEDDSYFIAEKYCTGKYSDNNKSIYGHSGNFIGGWIQYRKMFVNENITK